MERLEARREYGANPAPRNAAHSPGPDQQLTVLPAAGLLPLPFRICYWLVWPDEAGSGAPMMSDAIYARLTNVFREVFEDPNLALRPEMTARDVPGWIPGRMVEILMATEEAFGIAFTSREVDAMLRVGDLAETVGRKRLGLTTCRASRGCLTPDTGRSAWTDCVTARPGMPSRGLRTRTSMRSAPMPSSGH